MNAPYFTLSFGIYKMNGQGPIPKTQHIHDQQMFLLLTNQKRKFLQRAKKKIVTIQKNYFKATAK